MWLPQDYGRGPGEIQAAYSVPVHQPHVTPLRNQWLDAIKQIAPQIADYIKQKKSDEIANQLLQLEHAPAELQGKGQLGLHGAQLFQQYQQDQQANTPDTAMEDLQYQHLYRQTHPEQFPNQGRPMTQYQQEHLDLMRQREANRRPARQEKFLGLSRDLLDAPGYVKFSDATGNPVSTEQANANPSAITANAPGWKESVRYEQFRSGADAFRQAQGHKGKYEPDQSPQLLPSDVEQAKSVLNAEKTPTSKGSEQPIGMSKEQYDAMPSGTVYTAPDGSRRVKK